jgi:hypothetical protein
MTWKDVTTSDIFREAPPDERAEYKKQYFSKYAVPMLRDDGLTDDEIQTTAQEFFASVDDTGEGAFRSATSAFARGALRPLSDIPIAVGALTGSEGIESFGEDIQGGIESAFPVNPAQEGFFTTEIPGVAGQVTSMIGTGLGAGAAARALAGSTAAAKLGAKAAVGTQAFTGGAAGGAQRADELGLTPEEKRLRSFAGGATELVVEALPFGMLTETGAIRKLLGETGEQAAKRSVESGWMDFIPQPIREGVKTEAIEEGFTEGIGQATDIAFAPEQASMDLQQIGKAMLLGGVGGAMFGGVNAAIAPKTAEAFKYEGEFVRVRDINEAPAEVQQQFAVGDTSRLVLDKRGKVIGYKPAAETIEADIPTEIVLPDDIAPEIVPEVTQMVEGLTQNPTVPQVSKALVEDFQSGLTELPQPDMQANLLAGMPMLATPTQTITLDFLPQQPLMRAVPMQPASTPTEVTKPTQTITGSNVQTGTEMPVLDESPVTSPGVAPLTDETTATTDDMAAVAKAAEEAPAPARGETEVSGVSEETQAELVAAWEASPEFAAAEEAAAAGDLELAEQIEEQWVQQQGDIVENVVADEAAAGMVEPMREEDTQVSPVNAGAVPTESLPATGQLTSRDVGAGVAVRDTPEFAELQDLMRKKAQFDSKVKGAKFSAKDRARLDDLFPRFRDALFEKTDPENDPVVGTDINGTPIQQSQGGTFYTFENGRVRTGPAFATEAPDATPAPQAQPPAATTATQETQQEAAALATEPATEERPGQKRAAAGGEIGPNGEWYPGGAFIATTQMPKKVREKIMRAASGREQVEVGFGKDKFADINPGEIPIVARLYGTGIGPNGFVNEVFLDKQGFSEEVKSAYREASKRFAAGERFLKVTEFPLLANYSDLARLVQAGLPVPGAALDKMPQDVREQLVKASDAGKTRQIVDTLPATEESTAAEPAAVEADVAGVDAASSIAKIDPEKRAKFEALPQENKTNLAVNIQRFGWNPEDQGMTASEYDNLIAPVLAKDAAKKAEKKRTEDRIIENREAANSAPAVISVATKQELDEPFDGDDGYFYHITTPAGSKKILAQQSIGTGFKQSMSSGYWAEYSKGKAFLTDRNGVGYWIGRIEDHLESQERSPKTVVLRLPKYSVTEISVDEEGTRDANAPAWFSTKAIKPTQNETQDTTTGRSEPAATATDSGLPDDLQQDIRSASAFQMRLRDYIATLPDKAQAAWTPERLAAADSYYATGDTAALEPLTKVQQKVVKERATDDTEKLRYEAEQKRDFELRNAPAETESEFLADPNALLDSQTEEQLQQERARRIEYGRESKNTGDTGSDAEASGEDQVGGIDSDGLLDGGDVGRQSRGGVGGGRPSLLRAQDGTVLRTGVESIDAEAARNSYDGVIPGVEQTWVGTTADFAEQFPDGYPFGTNLTFPAPHHEALTANDGRPFIFTDQVQIHEGDVARAREYGTTPGVEAVKRTLRHESFAHRGFMALPHPLKRRFMDLIESGVIPASELDYLVTERKYSNLADWRDNISTRQMAAEEWLAHKLERMTELPKSGPVAEFLDWLRDVWDYLTGGAKPNDAVLRDTLRQMHKALGALEPGQRIVDEQVRASYIGEMAIENMPEERKQFMRDSLDTAKAMAAAGKSSEEIRAVTGWFPGPYDGKMRWELPDDGAKLRLTEFRSKRNDGDTPQDIVRGFFAERQDALMQDALSKSKGMPKDQLLAYSKQFMAEKKAENEGIQAFFMNGDNRDRGRVPLGYLLDHPELYAAYPDAKWMPVSFHSEDMRGSDPLSALGSYADGLIFINPALGFNDETGMLSTMLHEIQHWIQDTEGFAKGASPMAFYSGDTAYQDWDQIDELHQLAKERGESIDDALKYYDVIGLERPEQRLVDTAKDYTSERAAELKEYWRKRQNMFSAYENTAGEIEARDVQARQNLTPEQRRATAPFSSENIAPEDAIVMFGSGGVARASRQSDPINNNPSFSSASVPKTTAPRNPNRMLSEIQIGADGIRRVIPKKYLPFSRDGKFGADLKEWAKDLTKVKEASLMDLRRLLMVIRDPARTQAVLGITPQDGSSIIPSILEFAAIRADALGNTSLGNIFRTERAGVGSQAGQNLAAIKAANLDEEFSPNRIGESILSVEQEDQKARVGPQINEKNVIPEVKATLEAANDGASSNVEDGLNDEIPISEEILNLGIAAEADPEIRALIESIIRRTIIIGTLQAEDGVRPSLAMGKELQELRGKSAADRQAILQQELTLRAEEIKKLRDLSKKSKTKKATPVDGEKAKATKEPKEKLPKPVQTAKEIIDSIAKKVTGQQKAKPEPNKVRQLYKQQLKQPKVEAEFLKEALALGVDAVTAKKLHDSINLEIVAVSIGEDVAEGITAYNEAIAKRLRFMDVDSRALANFVNNLRREGKLTGEPIRWKEILSLPVTDQFTIKETMLERIKADEAFKDLSEAEQQALVDALESVWQKERAKLFKQMVKRADRKGMTKDAKQRIEDATPKLLEYINQGMLASDAFYKAVGEQYGWQPVSKEDRAKLEKLAAEMQEPGISSMERNMKQEEIVRVLQRNTRLSRAEVLSSFWVMSVLTGGRTQFDMALGILSGALSVLKKAVAVATTGKDPKLALKGLSDFGKFAVIAGQQAYSNLVKPEMGILRSRSASLNDATSKDNYKNVLTTGEKLMLIEDKPGDTEWQKTKNKIVRATGQFMGFWERLMAGWDHITATATYHGTLRLASGLNPKMFDAALIPNDADFENAIAMAKMRMPGASRARITALAESLLDDGVRSLGREIEESRMDQWRNMRDQALAEGRTASYQEDPTGVGGVVYGAIRSMTSGTEKMAKDWSDKQKEAYLKNMGPINALSKHLGELGYILATQAQNILGVRFMRFTGNKLNELISYVPVLGLARLREEGMMDGEEYTLRGRNVYHNQALGWAALTFYIYMLTRLDEPDEEKNIIVEGSWENLTPARKSQLMAAGRKPNTVRIKTDDGKELSFNYVSWPFAGWLAGFGSLSDVKRYTPDKWTEKTVADKTMSAAYAGAFAISDISSLSSLSELFGRSTYSTDPTEAFVKRISKAGSNYVGGFVPKFIKDIDSWFDDSAYRPENTWQHLAAQMPLLRRSAGAPVRDIFYEPVNVSRAPWSRAIQMSPDEQEYMLLGRLNSRGIWLTPPNADNRKVKSRTGKTRDMTEEEAVKYMQLTGEGYKQMLQQHGERLLSMDTDAAARLVEKYAARVRERALKKAVARGAATVTVEAL